MFRDTKQQLQQRLKQLQQRLDNLQEINLTLKNALDKGWKDQVCGLINQIKAQENMIEELIDERLGTKRTLEIKTLYSHISSSFESVVRGPRDYTKMEQYAPEEQRVIPPREKELQEQVDKLSSELYALKIFNNDLKRDMGIVLSREERLRSIYEQTKAKADLS